MVEVLIRMSLAAPMGFITYMHVAPFMCSILFFSLALSCVESIKCKYDILGFEVPWYMVLVLLDTTFLIQKTSRTAFGRFKLFYLVLLLYQDSYKNTR